MGDDQTLPCTDKLAFDTKEQANAVAATSKYHRGDSPKLKVYKCQHCKLWHLATNYGAE